MNELNKNTEFQKWLDAQIANKNTPLAQICNERKKDLISKGEWVEHPQVRKNGENVKGTP